MQLVGYPYNIKLFIPCAGEFYDNSAIISDPRAHEHLTLEEKKDLHHMALAVIGLYTKSNSD